MWRVGSLRFLCPQESTVSLKMCLDTAAKEETSRQMDEGKGHSRQEGQLLKGLEAGDLAFWKSRLCSWWRG